MPILAENSARYPPDWRLRSRFVRFVRARNRCEWCGARNGHPHPVSGAGVVLTVAHVFDRRPEAAGLLNLAALCQRCHNRHDAPWRAAGRRARLGAGSVTTVLDWRNVPAGFRHPDLEEVARGLPKW